jgi:gliding motility-associated-like protein
MVGQTTTEGTDFWMGFMENIHDPPGSPAVLQLGFSANERATVTVEGPRQNYSQTFTVQVGETTTVEMPIDDFMPGDMGRFGMGIHITSDVKISVYALNKRALSADAAVILPTNALGDDYVVFTHKEVYGLESEVLLVATENDTKIEVIPSQDLFNGISANEAFVVTLSQGETYQLKSNNDLSGTVVRSVSSNEDECKNFAVFGGTKMTFVGSCGANADHLFEQMFPTSTWGQEFLFVPYASRTGGDMLKVGAKEDNTVILVEGMSPITLNAGEVTLVSRALDGVRHITADKPISMAQFARSQDCDNQKGDPFMIMLSPMEQRIKSVTFRAFEAFEIEQYYLTLIARKDFLTDITLDGMAIGNRFTIQGDNAYARLEITQGNHTLSASDGVIAYVYGFGNIESFGYSAGVSLANFSLGIEAMDSQIALIDEVSCFTSTVSLSALIEQDPNQPPQFTAFDWDLGDGNTAEGFSVEHTYAEPGEYTITLVASDGSGACSTQETIIKEISVVETAVLDIAGPVSVCPVVQDIVYTSETTGAAAYQWTVVGGSVQGDASGESIVVDWGSGHPDASVSLVLINEAGCASERYELPVLIDTRLQPSAPSGPTTLCYNDRNGVVYSTAPAAGSAYQWYVDGGSFEGSNTGSQVVVNWNAGVGTIGFTESNPAITDCSGQSPALSVVVMEEITVVETVSHVSCANGNDGAITISLSGGEAPYYLSWSTGLEGVNETAITDLEAGIYSVTVTDAAGCMLSFDYEVNQPAVLQAAVDVLHVSCHGLMDGEATAIITGGTAPYTLEWNDSPPQTDLTLTGQPAGNYSLRVLDRNDCEFVVAYEITQPEPLTATTIDNPSCPGESTGSIFVEASGGTAPYYYRWNTSPPQDRQLIEGLPAGKYSVTVTDANGCSFTTESPEITERLPTINMPNAFTPNGDGVNDGFAVVTDCSLPTFEMKIYNSWGLLVFHTNDTSEAWDGTKDGQPAPTGKYTYHLAYRLVVNGEMFEDTRVGLFSLMR